MIKGMHAMSYTAESEALRAFLCDKLGLSSNSDNVHLRMELEVEETSYSRYNTCAHRGWNAV